MLPKKPARRAIKGDMQHHDGLRPINLRGFASLFTALRAVPFYCTISPSQTRREKPKRKTRHEGGFFNIMPAKRRKAMSLEQRHHDAPLALLTYMASPYDKFLQAKTLPVTALRAVTFERRCRWFKPDST